MKKQVFRSKYSIRFSTCTSWETLFDNPRLLDSENVYASRVIPEKDLLRKSYAYSAIPGLHVLDLIDRGSLKPDRSLYNQLLKTCTKSEALREGKLVHAHISRSKFKGDTVMSNTIINMYAKCGSLADARKVFDEMPDKDVVTWTTLITGYAQNRHPNEALSLFAPMLRHGFDPNQYTLSSLAKASGETEAKTAKQIHAYCSKRGYDSDVFVGSSLVDMYARLDDITEAASVFEGLGTKNEVSWNALISAFARKGRVEPALRLYSDMQMEGFRATRHTYSSLCTALAGTGSLERARWVHARVIKLGPSLVAFVGNTLLKMYVKSGSLEDAEKIFARLAIAKDRGGDGAAAVPWNTILAAYAGHGLGEEAVQRFEDMLKNKVKPDGETFLWVLRACGKAGLVNEGRVYFKTMRDFKVEPEEAHYAVMVDLLGRVAGLLERARKFISKIPEEPTAAVWGALLEACKVHGDLDLAVEAAERVFEIDPLHPGPHKLLLAKYSSTNRWDDADRVRKAMMTMISRETEATVNKNAVAKMKTILMTEPACSYVEIGDDVHVFVASDEPRNETEAMWEKMCEETGKVGYAPGKGYHVHWYTDLRSQRGNESLQRQSERFALAFALSRMSTKSTIRIKRAVRLCPVCRSAINYVSKKGVDERNLIAPRNAADVKTGPIVARNIVRLGPCSSCGKYWE